MQRVKGYTAPRMKDLPKETDTQTHERLKLAALKAQIRGEQNPSFRAGRRASISITTLGGELRPWAGSDRAPAAVDQGVRDRGRLLMTLRGVCERLRVSRFTLWRMVKRGQFPAPADTGKRRALWHPATVDAWCKENAAHFERVLSRVLPAALSR